MAWATVTLFRGETSNARCGVCTPHLAFDVRKDEEGSSLMTLVPSVLGA